MEENPGAIVAYGLTLLFSAAALIALWWRGFADFSEEPKDRL